MFPPALALFGLGLAGAPANSDAVDCGAASPGLGAFAQATVGVADLATALALWRDRFGMRLTAHRDGPDAGLARLWNLAPARIRRQALLHTPGATAGGLHLVEFGDPDPPVRAGAAVFDRLPKNIDVYARDLPARYAELAAAGLQFRAPWVELPGPNGLIFREVHLAAHDALNVVLLEVLGAHYRHSPAGYAAIGPLINVVGDADAEAAFLRDALGLEFIIGDLLSGPDIERMVGLPPGAGLDFRVYGDPDEPLGRIELVEYQQTAGEDRYARARPPATGLLLTGWHCADLTPLRARLEKLGIAFTEHGEIDAIYGRGPVISFRSPAGFRIEVQKR